MSEHRAARVAEYLDHMLQAFARISRYVQGGAAEFLRDDKTHDAVIRNIEIIGEAAKDIERVDPEFVAQHPEVPWPIIYAMRNRLSRGYFEVDLEVVCTPVYCRQCQRS